MDINIRLERDDDFRAVEELTREAFWNLYMPGCDEHYLVHIMRTHPDFIPELDFVAEYEGRIIGNIMYTKSFVVDEDDNRIDTLTFGPVCVHPDFQYCGVGSILIGHTKKLAVQKGAKAIIILGHPRNYCRHGFVNSRDFSISNPDGRYPFGQLVCELEKGIFAGRKWKFHYSLVYNIDLKEVEAFDSTFPYKEKETRPSQIEFSIAVRAFLD
ncbi:MAG: N-acetyltransferase [Spirochaetales bacterium]|nr:N-acetyltransferase [Spirochaetales bacterium]